MESENKKLQELIRYPLDSEKARNYVRDRLEGVNILSNCILAQLDFSLGDFFTLLLPDSNLGRIYEFEAGMVLPQNPDVDYAISGKVATYNPIANIKENFSLLIYNYLESHQGFCCIFDDVLRTKNSLNSGLLQAANVIYDFNDEIYYLISSKTIDEEVINECVRESESFWHSLGVISDVQFDGNKDLQLNEELFMSICLKAEMFFVGAYDGEGYVIWERRK